MPSRSPKQRRFMQIAAHNPDFAAEHGIRQETAKEWVRKDKEEAEAKRKKEDDEKKKKKEKEKEKVKKSQQKN